MVGGNIEDNSCSSSYIQLREKHTCFAVIRINEPASKELKTPASVVSTHRENPRKHFLENPPRCLQRNLPTSGARGNHSSCEFTAKTPLSRPWFSKWSASWSARWTFTGFRFSKCFVSIGIKISTRVIRELWLDTKQIHIIYVIGANVASWWNDC